MNELSKKDFRKNESQALFFYNNLFFSLELSIICLKTFFHLNLAPSYSILVIIIRIIYFSHRWEEIFFSSLLRNKHGNEFWSRGSSRLISKKQSLNMIWNFEKILDKVKRKFETSKYFKFFTQHCYRIGYLFIYDFFLL